jgi:glycosyltransferase involved in cell wall biosynthesis
MREITRRFLFKHEAPALLSNVGSQSDGAARISCCDACRSSSRFSRLQNRRKQSNMLRPVSIVTVTFDTYFFVRLLVEKVREFIGARAYEIIVVDRGSTDGTCEWLAAQSDVRLLTAKPDRSGHGHGEAAEFGVAHARYDTIVLLDSDAHPTAANWLELTADRLDGHHRIAGAVFHGMHKGNPAGWYIHPHFMVFEKEDLGGHVTLRKIRGNDWDTGEAATIQLLEAGFGVIGYPLEFCERFAVGHPHFPTVSAGVFHAWYGTRLSKEKRAVGRETQNIVTDASYREPLQAKLRAVYGLDY